MNNPDSGSQFLSPLRTQPLKKQRGGSTPDLGSRGGGGGGGSSSNSSSGRQPLTGGGSAATTNESAQDAIARRRAELRRLQALREARADSKRPEVTSSSVPSSAKTTTTTATRPSGIPKPPGGGVGVARHHSDLFPAVQKSPSRDRKAVPALAKPLPAPLPSLTPTSSSGTGSNTTSTDAATTAATATSTNSSRAKSAPPVRPPPPPPKAPGSAVATTTTTTPSTATSTTTSRPSPPAARPVPLSPGSLLLPPSVSRTTHPESIAVAPTAAATEAGEPPLLTTPTLSAPKWAEQDGKIIPLSPVPPKPLPLPKVEVSRTNNPSNNNKLPPIPPVLPTMDRTPHKAVGASSSTASTNADDAMTPAPVQTPMLPLSSRRERLSHMRAGLTGTGTGAATAADQDNYNNNDNNSAPSSPIRQSATAARLEQTLKETMQDKKMALQQIKLLEEELLKARQKEQLQYQQTATTPQPKTLQKMLHLAQAEGEAAAWKWAKSQVSGVPPLSSMESPLRPSAGASTSSTTTSGASANSIIHTMALLKPQPQPKLFPQPHHPNDQQRPTQPNMVMMERQLIQFFREAAECVALEYESHLATYYVRRPYGLEPVPTLLFTKVVGGLLNQKEDEYPRKAHISTSSTLHVAGTVKANGSTFLLSGLCDLKYQVNVNGEEADDEDDGAAAAAAGDAGDVDVWQTTSLDRPLANNSMVVTFIDNEGVERDWSPRQVLEEAMHVRDQYCRAITSTALAFKDRPPAAPLQPVPALVEDKPQTMEIAVDTSDIPDSPPVESVSVIEAKEVTKPPTQPDESGSGDVLAVFLGMIFRSIWNLITWLLIGLPLSILRGSIVCAFVIAIVSVIYLHLLEAHHNGQALSMLGAAGYHSNAVTGIL